MLKGKIVPLISDSLVAELAAGPEPIQNLLEPIIDAGCERLALTLEVEQLHDAYLSAEIVTEKFAGDALHVAHATLAEADAIVSWNFKHLVNPTQVRAFNTVNLKNGHSLVVIMTPADILNVLEESDEPQDE